MEKPEKSQLSMMVRLAKSNESLRLCWSTTGETSAEQREADETKESDVSSTSDKLSRQSLLVRAMAS